MHVYMLHVCEWVSVCMHMVYKGQQFQILAS